MLYRNFNSQAEIDREYNAVLSVSDLSPYIEYDQLKNSETIKELKCSLDEKYGSSPDETVDVFPSTVPNSPMLVFIHGGYWHSMSNKDFSLMARGLVLNGITVALPNYTLCPKATIQEIASQNRAAIIWLHKNAERFNGNPNKIIVSGHSAGGQQAGIIAATDWEGEYGLPNNLVKGALPISGIYDLTPMRYSWIQPKLQLNDEMIREQSPQFRMPKRNVPMLISYGENETAEFGRQAKDYCDALNADGSKATLHEQKEKNHFLTFRDLNDPESSFCKEVVKFIKQVCEK